jgi:hypothetical protein
MYQKLLEIIKLHQIKDITLKISHMTIELFQTIQVSDDNNLIKNMGLRDIL